MASGAIVSEDLAKKFATEKDSPYEKWVRGEGLDIVSAHYIANLRHGRASSPGRAAAARACSSTTKLRAPRTIATSAKSRPAASSPPSASSSTR